MKSGLPVKLEKVILHDASKWELDDHIALAEYLHAHDWLPSPLKPLGDADVERLSAAVERADVTRDGKKKALVTLAHSGNPRAAFELGRLVDLVEPSLRRFARLAWDESMQWCAQLFPSCEAGGS